MRPVESKAAVFVSRILVDKSNGLATTLRFDIQLSNNLTTTPIGENCENDPTEPPKTALNGENQPPERRAKALQAGAPRALKH